MKYRFSHVVDPSTYETDGLCDGIPLRVHRSAAVGDLGTIRLHRDWREHIGPLSLSDSYGGMGAQYSFTSVVMPECLPERLEIVSYAIEIGFLHDDVVDPPEAKTVGTAARWTACYRGLTSSIGRFADLQDGGRIPL